MKNKIKLKKLLIKTLILTVLVLTLFLIMNFFEYRTYTRNFNTKLSSVITIVKDKYPNISDNEIMEIINSQDEDSGLLKKYNIDIYNDTVVLKNDSEFKRFLIINSAYLLAIILCIAVLFLRFNHRKDNEINEITEYIRELNRKNYKLNIDENTEDELSILKNEIYKTTIMLKEQAENSTNEKHELKVSLSDISHQLKTPLTSILIILDNLIEDTQMDAKTRQDFIFDVKREINNINFLVQNLLKLSKLDTDSVKFYEEKVKAEDIVNEAVTKLSTLCDLRNIVININSDSKTFITADPKWQVEALSNIIKNCIEYSADSSSVDIEIKSNKIYSEITVRDYGKGIDKKDLPHIFERFYKGKNASGDSVGIGLALAKSIIERSGGKVTVESELGSGTLFSIKYF